MWELVTTQNRKLGLQRELYIFWTLSIIIISVSEEILGTGLYSCPQAKSLLFWIQSRLLVLISVITKYGDG
jgi:hypothetical protein